MRSTKAGGHRAAKLCCIASIFCIAVTNADQQMATWLGGSGSWTNASQWSGGVVPNNTATTTYQVEIDGGNPIASAVQLNSGNIGVDSLNIDSGDSLLVNAGTCMLGSVEVNGSLALQSNAKIFLAANKPLAGTGTVNFINLSSISAASGATIIGPNITLSGGKGVLSDLYLSGGPDIGNNTAPLINQGHIVADGSQNLLIVGGSTIENQGTLEVKNGATLAIDTDFSLATIGTLINNGGAFAIRRTFDNTGQTFLIDNAHGNWSLGGTIHGGTIVTRDGRSLYVPYVNAARLDSVTLNGKISLNGDLAVPAGQAFSGDGEIFIANPEAIEGIGNVHAESGTTTIGAGMFVHGGISIGFDVSPGRKAAIGNEHETLHNFGTIASDENGKRLYLLGSSIDNSGVLEVADGAELDVLGDLSFGTGARMKIDGIGTMKIGGPLNIPLTLDLSSTSDYLDVSALPGGAAYNDFPIVTYTGALSGTFSNVTPGIMVSYNTPGEIRISGVPIPEPGLVSLVAIACSRRQRVRARRPLQIPKIFDAILKVISLAN